MVKLIALNIHLFANVIDLTVFQIRIQVYKQYEDICAW